jgi:molecular chaperone GrpE (heat shock protein)
LIELSDRLQRLAQAFASPPRAASWWGGSDARWRKAWEAQRGGFAIVLNHLDALLAHEGLTRIETAGRPFDPTVMAAVATVPDDARPASTVVEEVAAGYRRFGEVLRPAQVKVTRPAASGGTL